MADKEAANRFNFESVESKEEFLVYLKNKKMTHNEFFYIHCKICEGSFPTEKKYKEGFIDAAEVERIFELQQQGAHTKADNVLKRVSTCKKNVYCTHHCMSQYSHVNFFRSRKLNKHYHIVHKTVCHGI